MPPSLAPKISEAYAARCVIGGICHGPLGLLCGRTPGGEPMVAHPIEWDGPPTPAKDRTGLVLEAIAVSMTRVLGQATRDAGRERAATIVHDIEDYHITPEQAARIANEARAKPLVYYHLAPAPGGFLARRLFARDINDARHGEWAIADDGSRYTLPIGTEEVKIGSMDN